MSLSPAIIDALVASGVSAEQLGAAMKAALQAEESARAERRAKAAERQRKSRAGRKLSRDVTVTERDSREQNVTAPDGSCPPDPLNLLNPDTPPSPPKGGSVPPRKRATEGSRLATDFELPDDWRAWAISAGLDPPRVTLEAEKFRDFWCGKPGKDGRKSDWPGTWRNWVRRALESPNARQSPDRHRYAERRGGFGTVLAELSEGLGDPHGGLSGAGRIQPSPDDLEVPFQSFSGAA